MPISNQDFISTPRKYHSLPRQCKPCNAQAQGISPRLLCVRDFRIKLNAFQVWFRDFDDEQKNIVLQELMGLCGPAQNHLLSVRLQNSLHERCPPNCQDLLSWLPAHVVSKVLSYLDPVSLARCSAVCRQWRVLAGGRLLWRRLCALSEWQVSPETHRKQVAEFTDADGRVNWKEVFIQRYRLRRNWLQGHCHVRTFEGHGQGISCVQFDDTRIVSGSHDNSIKVWNIRTNSPWSVMTLLGHSGTVRCLHLLENRLVSGSTDTTIKVWDLSTQLQWSSIACKVTMVGHGDTVRCVQMDEEKVVSGSYDRTLRVWCVRSGRCQAVLTGHTGQILCLRFEQLRLVSGAADKTIKVWSLSEGRCLRTLEGHGGAVTTLTFDDRRIISGSLDCTIRLWNIDTGEPLAVLDWMKNEGHTGVVRCLVADRWRIVSASDDKTLKVWSLDTGQRLVTLRQHTDGVTCVQFNDSVIVSGSYDKTVKLWDFSVC
ncbi:F-box/WD repeat-containing protein 7-like [Amphibalanus amphitrite]|uniref:F-box/WD repeat-containing protein 7-like n=1 Tax=Amphibalanus amphitrite TaxID=1232801 RepID=UPI001C904DD2|nr:F-box/WD repeat-containing protein 7-like [Amphibalanus amphitrite]XP_043193055.1 F-box/WD repeat-containing protein 7-like [Amphibalanus amphitrite]XP_043193056.1 F-box/WD repeat-containing protein 7-like [Amphibalanus amphitrite]XP_043193057.1 F-box/WD repeat-containing protein 7-like [Amphibalanus amphitrite]XP_043193058.1 F-box/WD repeat-containing protein 7-like [Amphibalanus amphitrite]XP_043219981.1 F-box/WD repeat-containing protein 7-like [Amphibalanus amphitrite]XP_043219982.1 F-